MTQLAWSHPAVQRHPKFKDPHVQFLRLNEPKHQPVSLKEDGCGAKSSPGKLFLPENGLRRNTIMKAGPGA